MFPLSYENINLDCSLNVQNIQFFIYFRSLQKHHGNVSFESFSERSESSNLNKTKSQTNIQLKCFTKCFENVIKP